MRKKKFDGIAPTKAVQQAARMYRLRRIYTGDLGGFDRYIRSTPCFGTDAIKDHLNETHFVVTLNHFEPGYACWTVWGTPYMDYNSAKEIYEKERNRRLWDSCMLYYDDGEEILDLCL